MNFIALIKNSIYIRNALAKNYMQINFIILLSKVVGIIPILLYVFLTK